VCLHHLILVVAIGSTLLGGLVVGVLVVVLSHFLNQVVVIEFVVEIVVESVVVVVEVGKVGTVAVGRVEELVGVVIVASWRHLECRAEELL